ncbi:MAG TPA: hypothetical protein VE152_00715 [Acidimicrobiales bacterium]|nr:hypothetical protein [Acidimicrobiales bacterium]
MRRVGRLTVALVGVCLGAAACGGAGSSTPDKGPVGAALTLGGGGEQVAVTAVRVVDPARPADRSDLPHAGNRLVGVELRVTDTGTTPVDQNLDSQTHLQDASGETFHTAGFHISAGPEFPGGHARLAPGQTQVGYATFVVPRSARLTAARVTLAAGFDSSTGTWDVGTHP